MSDNKKSKRGWKENEKDETFCGICTGTYDVHE